MNICVDESKNDFNSMFVKKKEESQGSDRMKPSNDGAH